MKPLLVSIFFICCFNITLSAQTIVQASDVPDAVKKEFTIHYPEGKSPVWKQSDPGFVEVDFWLNKKILHGMFAASGQWVSTEWDIKVDSVPEEIITYLNTEEFEMKGRKFSEEASPPGTEYNVEAKRGGTEYELVFTSEGKLKMKAAE